MIEVPDQDFKTATINMFKDVKSKNMKPKRHQKYKI